MRFREPKCVWCPGSARTHWGAYYSQQSLNIDYVCVSVSCRRLGYRVCFVWCQILITYCWFITVILSRYFLHISFSENCTAQTFDILYLIACIDGHVSCHSFAIVRCCRGLWLFDRPFCSVETQRSSDLHMFFSPSSVCGCSRHCSTLLALPT